MILIKNGEVHVGNGQILKEHDVLIEDGKIREVRGKIKETESMEVIDATGHVVLPGFVNTLSGWGANGPAWGDNDLNEHTDPVIPQMNSVYAFDYEAINFQAVHEYGVTSFGLAPSKHNVIGGRISAFKTRGNNPYKMMIKEDVGMAASVTAAVKETYKATKQCPMSKLGIYALLKQALSDAASCNSEDTCSPKTRHLKRVFQNQLPLFVNCCTSADIHAVNMILKEFQIKAVLTGAYGITDNPELSSTSIVLGNLTDSMITTNYKMDIEAIKRMMKRETTFAISTCGDSEGGGKENLLWNGILYYQKGIEAEDILQMLTLNPAKILGIANRVGSIEIGKDADIAIWSNNPIETFDAKLMNCFIDGEDMALLERRTTCW